MQSSAPISVCVVRDGSDQREHVQLPALSLAALKSAAASKLALDPATLSLAYVDDEDDVVSLRSDDELEEAFFVANELQTPLEVTVKGEAVKPAPVKVAAKPAVRNCFVFPAAAAARGVRHHAICDVCRKTIYDVRFKCLQCPDYDLCGECEEKNGAAGELHDRMHTFMKLRRQLPYFGRKPLMAFSPFEGPAAINAALRAQHAVPQTQSAKPAAESLIEKVFKIVEDGVQAKMQEHAQAAPGKPAEEKAGEAEKPCIRMCMPPHRVGRHFGRLGRCRPIVRCGVAPPCAKKGDEAPAAEEEAVKVGMAGRGRFCPALRGARLAALEQRVAELEKAVAAEHSATATDDDAMDAAAAPEESTQPTGEPVPETETASEAEAETEKASNEAVSEEASDEAASEEAAAPKSNEETLVELGFDRHMVKCALLVGRSLQNAATLLVEQQELLKKVKL